LNGDLDELMLNVISQSHPLGKSKTKIQAFKGLVTESIKDLAGGAFIGN